MLAETTGDIPLPRCDHSCCVIDQKMFVFGGSAGESLWLNDLSYLNLGIMGEGGGGGGERGRGEGEGRDGGVREGEVRGEGGEEGSKGKRKYVLHFFYFMVSFRICL